MYAAIYIFFSRTCRQTLDFSSRYCSILAPSMAPRMLKWMSMYFPKRDELSLRMVLALPNAERDAREESSWHFPRAIRLFNTSGTAWHTARFCLAVVKRRCIWVLFDFSTLPSRMGFASSTCCSIQECWPLMAARNCRISLVLSVFPAPDSPLASNHRKTQNQDL